jgi:hypothetical protein
MPRRSGETDADGPKIAAARDEASPAAPELLGVHFHSGPIDTAPLHPTLKKLLAFWSGKCGDRAMPARDDLPVRELKPWLGHLAIIESAPGTFRFRLCGTDLIARFGREMTGLTLAQIAPDSQKALAAMLDLAIAKQAPVVAAITLRYEGRRTLWSELMLPLAGAPAPFLFSSYPVQVGPGLP